MKRKKITCNYRRQPSLARTRLDMPQIAKKKLEKQALEQKRRDSNIRTVCVCQIFLLNEMND